MKDVFTGKRLEAIFPNKTFQADRTFATILRETLWIVHNGHGEAGNDTFASTAPGI